MSEGSSGAGTSRRGIAVFGSGEVGPGEAPWELARELGTLLGERGVPVVTGGYGGVMEAASRGAREAGGEAIGVPCALFRGRTPNRWLSRAIVEPDLLARTRRLVELSRGFVVLAGKAGTLAELATLWALLRAGLLAAPVVILDETWGRMYADLDRVGRLDPAVREWTRRAASAGEAIRLVLDEERPR